MLSACSFIYSFKKYLSAFSVLDSVKEVRDTEMNHNLVLVSSGALTEENKREGHLMWLTDGDSPTRMWGWLTEGKGHTYA